MFDKKKILNKEEYFNYSLLHPFLGVLPNQNKKELICFSNAFYPNAFEQKYNHKNFFKEKNPSLYICEVRNPHKKSIGIIAALPLSVFNERILRHENVIKEKALHYTRVFKKTGLQLNPVVLFHENIHEINALMENATQKRCSFQIDLLSTSYKIWTVHESNIIEEIRQIYSNLDFLFIADGHHRLEGLIDIAEQGMFMAFLLPENQIFSHDICRIYPSLTNIENIQIENMVKKYFFLTEKINFYSHDKENIQLYTKNKKYSLSPIKNDLFFNNSHFFFELLNKVQNSDFSFSFNNFSCTNIHEFHKDNLEKNENYTKFFIPSINIDYLYNLIKKGGTLPPHSTWFEPKLPSRLISFPLDC